MMIIFIHGFALCICNRFADDECQIKRLPFIMDMATHKEQIVKVKQNKNLINSKGTKH